VEEKIIIHLRDVPAVAVLDAAVAVADIMAITGTMSTEWAQGCTMEWNLRCR
jgi:hypothetical protein